MLTYRAGSRRRPSTGPFRSPGGAARGLARPPCAGAASFGTHGASLYAYRTAPARRTGACRLGRGCRSLGRAFAHPSRSTPRAGHHRLVHRCVRRRLVWAVATGRVLLGRTLRRGTDSVGDQNRSIGEQALAHEAMASVLSCSTICAAGRISSTRSTHWPAGK